METVGFFLLCLETLFEFRSVNTFFAKRVQNQQKKKHAHTLMNQHDFKVPFIIFLSYICFPQRIFRRQRMSEKESE